jgi:hypothetical protein
MIGSGGCLKEGPRQKKTIPTLTRLTPNPMVLAELGQKIAGALRSLATKTVIDQGKHVAPFLMQRCIMHRREPGCANKGDYHGATEERCEH